jgi:hypothetical protein
MFNLYPHYPLSTTLQNILYELSAHHYRKVNIVLEQVRDRAHVHAGERGGDGAATLSGGQPGGIRPHLETEG